MVCSKLSTTSSDKLICYSGTSFAFIGTSPSSPSQRSTVTIDGTVFNVDDDDPSPYTYRQWFQSPNLVDGFHVVRGNCSAGTVLDFAIVTAGTRPPHLVLSPAIFVDDDSPYILLFRPLDSGHNSIQHHRLLWGICCICMWE
jgi:hypothetical protein